MPFTKFFCRFNQPGYISLRRRTRKWPAKKEKAPDKGDRLPSNSNGRAKQSNAGTAGAGGQRRGHPKLMDPNSPTVERSGLTSPPVAHAVSGREPRTNGAPDPRAGKVSW